MTFAILLMDLQMFEIHKYCEKVDVLIKARQKCRSRQDLQEVFWQKMDELDKVGPSRICGQARPVATVPDGETLR